MNIIFLFVLTGMAVGLLASLWRGVGLRGALGDSAVSVLGALIGGLLFRFVYAEGGALLGAMAVAAMGAVCLVVDLRLLQRSFAEQLLRRVLWSRRSTPSKRGFLEASQPEAGSMVCPVCGQKHLL